MEQNEMRNIVQKQDEDDVKMEIDEYEEDLKPKVNKTIAKARKTAKKAAKAAKAPAPTGGSDAIRPPAGARPFSA